jgi:hypothetical protein
VLTTPQRKNLRHYETFHNESNWSFVTTQIAGKLNGEEQSGLIWQVQSASGSTKRGEFLDELRTC